MTQDLTARDIFQQLDSRVTRVEDDLRAFRTEVNSRFDRIEAQLSQINTRFDARFDQLQWRSVGLALVTWLSLMGSIWLKT